MLISHGECGYRSEAAFFRVPSIDNALRGADAFSALDLDAKRAVNLRDRSAAAFGLGANLTVSYGIAETNVHWVNLDDLRY
jgi:hypothetical protein